MLVYTNIIMHTWQFPQYKVQLGHMHAARGLPQYTTGIHDVIMHKNYEQCMYKLRLAYFGAAGHTPAQVCYSTKMKQFIPTFMKKKMHVVPQRDTFEEIESIHEMVDQPGGFYTFAKHVQVSVIANSTCSLVGLKFSMHLPKTARAMMLLN